MAANRPQNQAPLLNGVLEEVWIRLAIALSFTAAIMDFVAFLYIPTEQNLTILASKGSYSAL